MVGNDPRSVSDNLVSIFKECAGFEVFLMELPDKVFNMTYHLKRTTRPIVVIRAILANLSKRLHDNETCIYIFVKFSLIIFWELDD